MVTTGDFLGTFYSAVSEGGGIVFRSNDAVLARLSRYVLGFGSVHNLRQPVTDDWIVLDHTQGLAVGNAVELRNEYQLARANLPVIHRCCILEVRDDAVRVDVPPLLPALREQQGCFLLHPQQCAITAFDCQVIREDTQGAIWQLNGACDTVDVELRLSLRTDRGDVELQAMRRFRQAVQVLHEEVTFDRLPPLAEAYRKNRQCDDTVFQRRYTLDREGACFRNSRDEGLYLYGNSDACSFGVHNPAAAFSLREITPFRAAPHDLQAALHGDIYRYASVRTNDGKVTFEADFAQATELHGLRILWYKHQATRVTVEAPDNGRWKTIGEFSTDVRPLGVYRLVNPVRAQQLRLTLETPDNITLRAIDFLVGGEGFELSITLDDHRDHRYCRYLAPELRTEAMGTMVMQMRSATPRVADEEVSVRCVLHIGKVPAVRPRLMHVPGGAQAMLLWTEHADRASLESHRATYFGRSDITSAKDAVGGFVRHRIPVTKSAFWRNPKRQPCSTVHTAPQVALDDDPDYLAFCRELAAFGHEICVHAPWPTNSPPAACREAADYFAQHFQSVTWIDHSARVVHCGMSGQGLNRESDYYMADHWHKTGFRCFWQFASEDAAEQRVGSINLQQLRLGDWMHTPLYWRYPSETQDFISWPTGRSGDIDLYTQDAIDELVDEWGISINHTYPPAHYDNPARSLYLMRREDGIFTSTPMFEEALARFARKVESGRLVALTVRQALDYWLALEAIETIRDANGCARMANRSGKELTGFSFVLRGVVELAPDTAAKLVNAGTDTIVTLDLAANAAVSVTSDVPGRFLVTQAIASHPPATDSDTYPVIDVDLGFAGDCRERCNKLFVSAQGMVRNGFIGEGVRGEKQHLVAYLPLKDYDYDGYVAFVRKHGNANAVREARKAAEAGFIVAPFPRYLYIPDIHAINTSTAERGGKPMAANYAKSIEEMGGAPKRDIPLKPPECLKHNQTYFGVFEPIEGYKQGEVTTNRRLVAYVSVNKYGNCAIYTLFLGHHDFLKRHVMNLLHFETVRALRDPARADFRDLDYLMYHRYHNQNPGLTFWKKKAGFMPGYWINRGEKIL
jgi:hypothetical protein